MILSVDDVEYYKRCRNIRKRLDKIKELNCPHLWYDKEQDIWIAIGENPCPDCEREPCSNHTHSWDGENMNLLVIKTEDLL